MLGPKGMWELHQASFIAMHHQKNPGGKRLGREVEIPLTGTVRAAF